MRRGFRPTVPLAAHRSSAYGLEWLKPGAWGYRSEGSSAEMRRGFRPTFPLRLIAFQRTGLNGSNPALWGSHAKGGPATKHTKRCGREPAGAGRSRVLALPFFKRKKNLFAPIFWGY
jgi:hypothetical protein